MILYYKSRLHTRDATTCRHFGPHVENLFIFARNFKKCEKFRKMMGIVYFKQTNIKNIKNEGL